MFSCTSNSTGLAAKLRAIEQGRPDARKRAAIAMVQEVARVAVVIAPKDTNRYVNAIAQAANTPPISAGITVPPIQASRTHERVLEALADQVSFWQMIVSRTEQQGRTDYKGKGRSGLTASYRKAVEKLRRAKEELAKLDPESIVIGGIATGGGGFRQFAQKGRRLKLTVRNKKYGGEGLVIDAGGVTLVQLRNKEPHAQIVEWKFGVMRKAGSVAKAVGGRVVGRAYVNQVMGKVK